MRSLNRNIFCKLLRFASVSAFYFILEPTIIRAQEISLQLTLEDVIQLSKTQSIDALVSKQVFQQSNWEYKTFRTERLPMVNMDLGLINYNRSATNRSYDYITNQYQYFSSNNNTSRTRLGVTENIGLTGGSLSAGFDLVRNDDFNLDKTDYASNPSIQYNQPLFAFNKFKWDKKIEPKKFEIAKAKYNQDQEDITIKAVNLFFDLANTQVNMEVAEKNLANSDTLFKISQGRYQMGRISENELLQMELNFLNCQSSLNSAKISLYNSKIKLISFLRLNADKDINLIVPDSVPDFEVSVDKALYEAKQNNPEMLILESQLLSAQQDVAQKKAEKGINANLALAWGYSRVDTQFPEIITNRDNLTEFQNVQVGIQIPIIDWGAKKGPYKVAVLKEEIVQLQVDQSVSDFTQNIILQILQFNQLKSQFAIAQKSELVAGKRYDVTKQRFLIGKIDVLDLNVAQKDRDAENANYINALRTYWDAFYLLRKNTLYDFLKAMKISHFDESTE